MTNAMQTSGTSPVFKAAEAFMPQVEGKLHAWVEVEVEGKGCLCCGWNDGASSYAEIVHHGGDQFGSLVFAVRAFNRSMRATATVVDMLLSLYKSHNGKVVADRIGY